MCSTAAKQHSATMYCFNDNQFKLSNDYIGANQTTK